MLENLFTLSNLVSLLTLVVMEIVLGIDNIIFVSILCGKLPSEEQRAARTMGLTLALVMRIILLFGITWIIGFKEPLFTVFGYHMSGKDLILMSGGLFLMYSSTKEIHGKMEGEEEGSIMDTGRSTKLKFRNAILQIVLLDVVFSFDSILTAVGMVENNLPVMITAVVISLFIMLFFSGWVSDFINKHPTVKMLALAFLLMIGLLLVAEGFQVHVPKGYIYFAMTFSLFVETLNMRARRRRKK